MTTNAQFIDTTTAETDSNGTSADSKRYYAKKFGITPEEIVWYHSGNCYDRIMVTTKDAAKKVARAVKGRTANGGWYHGMPLGGFHETDEGFDVTC